MSNRCVNQSHVVFSLFSVQNFIAVDRRSYVSFLNVVKCLCCILGRFTFSSHYQTGLFLWVAGQHSKWMLSSELQVLEQLFSLNGDKLTEIKITFLLLTWCICEVEYDNSDQFLSQSAQLGNRGDLFLSVISYFKILIVPVLHSYTAVRRGDNQYISNCVTLPMVHI